MSGLFQKGKAWGWAGLIFVACWAAGPARAAEWFVATNGNDAAAGTNWATAKLTIQAAIDAAVSNDTVWVSNGVYATGERVVYGLNRVVIDKPITVQSVNGPSVTVIKGAWDPATTNGNAAVRCAYVGTNATLSGFTLTNGATRTDGYSYQMSGGGAWCEASGVLSNCVLIGNSAFENGGGSYRGTINNCTFTGNSAGAGGGAANATLNNCTLSGNSAAHGGGSSYGTLNNCTLTGNSAARGGGAFCGALNNCIVYYNTAILFGQNHYVECGYSSTFSYSCTTPLPAGTGNIDDDPLLAGASHLASDSPCIGRGSGTYSSGVDIDGQAWLTPPPMGCDEWMPGSITGALNVSAWAAYTNVVTGFAVPFRADISGNPTSSAWQWGDGLTSSNQPYATHAFASTGIYEVVLMAYNESVPLGVSATVTVRVAEQMIHYVKTSNPSSAAPYTSWATAATNIQHAIDAVSQAGALVRVSNGVYATGGRVVYGAMTNRVVIDKPITVKSVNGPDVTIIRGAWDPATTIGNAAVRCAYVGTGATLSGFMLTKGATRTDGDYFFEICGGGAWCAASGILSNCTLTGNSADNGGGSCYGTLNNCTLSGNTAADGGGGARYGTLNNCTLSGNSTSRPGAMTTPTGGGGACFATLNNCTLSGNSAYNGGGSSAATLNNCMLSGNTAFDAGGGSFCSTLNNCTLSGNSASRIGGGTSLDKLNNCIVYFNTAPAEANFSASAFTNSCTTPDPGGTGNTTNDPQFVDAAAENYRLKTNSPCIDRGSNAYVQGTTDLDGNPRIRNHVVDMGAYEFKQPADWYITTNGNDSADGAAWLSAKATIQAAIDAALNGDTVWVSNGVYATGGRIAWSESGLPSSSNRLVIDKAITVQSINGPEVTIIQGAKDPTSANGLGDASVRCAFVEANAVLTGFTLTNGATGTNNAHAFQTCGGGVVGSGILSNCTLTGNSALSAGGGSYYSITLNNCTLMGNSARYGGGAQFGTLNNCWVVSNSAQFSGGGTAHSTLNNCMVVGNIAHGYYGGGSVGGTLNNCTVVGNAANAGGGVASCVLNGCIVFFNTASTEQNYQGCSFNYCCTDPNLGGIGNITNDPQFVNAAAGNYRLQANSPCIDAGDNAFVQGTTDLDGNPRIRFGAVDMGAYEMQFPFSYRAWASEITNGLTNDTDSAAGDGMPNLLKYATGGSPMEADGLARLDLGFDGGLPTLRFNRNTNATDVTLVIQGADEMSDGAAWRGLATNVNGSWGGVANVSESGPGNPVACAVQDPVPLITNRFLRLKVTRP